MWVIAMNIMEKQIPNFKFLIKFHSSKKSGRIMVTEKYFLENFLSFVSMITLCMLKN